MSVNLELEKKIVDLINAFKNNSYLHVIDEGTKLFSQNNTIPVFANLVGASYASINDHVNAINFYKKALEIDTNNFEILNNLGKSQIELLLYSDALNTFNKSLDINPNNYDTYFNLGIIFFEKENYEDALNCYLKAIELNNKFDKLFYNVGILKTKVGRNKEAINYFEKTLEINNLNTKALNNLSNIYISENKYDVAKHYLEKAIKIDPKHAKAYNNLGTIYLQKKEYQTALDNFTIAFKLDKNLIISGVQKHFLKRLFCDWSENDELKLILEKSIIDDNVVSPWFCLAIDDNSKNHYLRACNFSKKFKTVRTNNNIYQNKKIKIGYFAADFHEHPGMINMSGIFQNHNKDEFEIIGFYYGEIRKDKTHERIKKFFDKFFYVNDLDDSEIYQLSIENKIDIAIYRAGLTVNARSSIFSQKVAPIQINYLGYQGTTGQDGVDYIIGDSYVIPKNQKSYYTEKIITLPGCYFPRDNQRKTSEAKFNRSDFNIPENAFVFCNFNNSYKVTYEEFEIWMNILQKVKNSILLLLETNNQMKENIYKEAEKLKISTDRIIFVKRIRYEDHLSRHSLANLFLDTFNYNAHTTAVDALWTGLPILTKSGNSFSSRVCGSLLKYFELNELITFNNEDYLNKAVELANNLNKINEIKNKILNCKKTDKYFDTKNYTKNLEKIYKTIHKNRIIENKFEDLHL